MPVLEPSRAFAVVGELGTGLGGSVTSRILNILGFLGVGE